MLCKKSLFAFPAILISFLIFFAFAGEVKAAEFSIVTDAVLPNGTDGKPYFETLKAFGGVPKTSERYYEWITPSKNPALRQPSATGLPAGINFRQEGDIAIVSGTTNLGNPDAVKYTFTVDVWDKNDFRSRRFEITINSSAPQVGRLQITSPSTLRGYVGVPIDHTFTAMGADDPNSYSWSKSDLPKDLLFEGEGPTGLPEAKLLGIPKEAGVFPFKVTVRSSTEAVDQIITLTVSSLQISPETLSEGRVKENYARAVRVEGGVPSYKWEILSSLPNWLTYTIDEESGGTTINFNGIPPSAGNFPLSLRVQDGSQRPATAQKDFQIIITGDDSGADAGGASGLKGKLEVNWPPSPLGTRLTEKTDIPNLVKYIYEWGISLGGFAAFIILVIAGFQYLTSAGNAGKMKDAVDRIKSAILGLVLLLASVLILNTINPQLTQLKIPPLSPPKFELATSTVQIKDINFKTCEGASLYPSAGYKGNPVILNPPEDIERNPITVGSVDITGGLCQVKLCKLNDPNVCENPDYPSTSFSNDTPVLEGGATNFGSAKLINLYYIQK